MQGKFHELELKLKIAHADIARLRRHKAIRQYLIGKPRTRRLISIYYDTPDLQLLNAKISLRVRRMSGGWFQSIKTAGSSNNGLHSRMEWEDMLKSERPDFNKITEHSIQQLFAHDALRQSLNPIFITDVKRTEWQINFSEAQIEVALDVGSLQIAGVNQADICELELELKSGSEQALFALADQLKSTLNLVPENTSKAELGYAFYMAQNTAEK